MVYNGDSVSEIEAWVKRSRKVYERREMCDEDRALKLVTIVSTPVLSYGLCAW